MFERFYAVCLDSSGKILVAGKDLSDGTLVFRLTAAGVIDTNFSNRGIAYDYYNIAITSEDKIVIVGQVTSPSASGFIARYNSDGTLDTTFNKTGYINSSQGENSNEYRECIITSSGKIIVVGAYYVGDAKALIAQYTTKGLLDVKVAFSAQNLIQQCQDQNLGLSFL
jgi:uncharacterized delta-60 repeat protein